MRERALDGFAARFGRPAERLVRAPGRVNLIGEHTDYNDGFVLPVALDRAAWLAVASLEEPLARVAALDLSEEASFPLDPVPPRGGDWADYPRGVAWALQEAGLPVTGLQAALTSDVPPGAGLSSSAAVEMAFAWAWRSLGGFGLDRTQTALLCQRAENLYVGVRCGIMDQMACAWGRAGHALLLDCRTLAVEPVPLPAGLSIVVADTGVRRALAASAYNQRRQECEEAVRLLSAHLPDIRALRDVSPADLSRLEPLLPEVLRRRARHVVGENARVHETVAALRAGDLAGVGAALRRSHESLRDDYQVSAPELDTLVEAAWQVEGCYGARLTGAGFGGCIVALAAQDAVADLVAHLERAYRDRFDRRPSAIVGQAADGVAVVA
jgi:galactokinase